MRDLYSRLNLSPDASSEEIKSAIAACSNASLKIDATEVLLFPNRRRIYDRLNATLIALGHLRATLGLSHGDNWFGEEATEYAQSPVQGVSKYFEFAQKLKRSRRRIEAKEFLNSIGEIFIGLVKMAAGFAAIVAIGWIIVVVVDKPTSKNPAGQPSSLPSSVPVFTEPVVPLPYSGTIRRRTSAEALAPFEIKTSPGSNYLVKLEDAKTRRYVMDIFVRGGETIEVAVPLGSYIVKYAAGTTWYGYEYYFGPNTGYNKADTVFHFRQHGNQISGYTITLYRVSHGNLKTSRIRPSQF